VRIGKKDIATIHSHVTSVELLDTSFSMKYVPYKKETGNKCLLTSCGDIQS
jgi:hypothetical protein